MRFGDNRLSIAAPFQAKSSTVSCVPQNPSHYTQYSPVPSTQQLWEDAAPLQNSADYLCSQEVRGSSMAGQLPSPPFTPSIHTAKDGIDTDESYFQLTGPPLGRPSTTIFHALSSAIIDRPVRLQCCQLQ